jgi:NitT/TauT family transport system permease protein
MKRFVSRILPPVVPFILVVLLLEILVRRGVIQSFIVPPPSEVLDSLIDDRKELFEAFLSTSAAAAIGLALSIVLGTSFAVLLSISSLVRRAIYPYAIFFQTVPIIAIAPLLVIWFGFGQPTVVASAFIVSIFPVIASVLLGLQSTEPALVDLFKLYSATRVRVLFKLRLPYAMPQILSGVRIASGLAVIGAVVGEFIAGGGLGSVVDAARTQQRIDKVFAAVLISAALGLLMVSLIDLVGWITLRKWHASYSKQSV